MSSTEPKPNYMTRHRTICAVLEEMRGIAEVYRPEMIPLIDEAKDYAQRMSNRLSEYRRAEQGK